MQQIRPITPADFSAVVALNSAVVSLTSAMDDARLAKLLGLCKFHRVLTINNTVAAFILVMPKGVDYDSVNYRWFDERLGQFLYIDRIVVDSAFSGQGHGDTLYKALFDYADSEGIHTIVCEYNSVPINEVSQRFHHKWGFREMGSQWLAHDTKKVSMQIASVNLAR